MKKILLIVLAMMIGYASSAQVYGKLGGMLSQGLKPWMEAEAGYELPKNNGMLSLSVYTDLQKQSWSIKYGATFISRLVAYAGINAFEGRITPLLGAEYRFRKRYYAGMVITEKYRFFTAGIRFHKYK